jgi:putative ABC transport system permease protein
VLAYHRSVLLAVFAAGLLAALASSSSPFVTTAVGSEALKNRLAEMTSFAAGVKIDGEFTPGVPFWAQTANALKAARELQARVGHLAAPVLTLQTLGFQGSGIAASGTAGSGGVLPMTRSDAVAHVRVIGEVSGPGVFISDITAQATGVRPGGMLSLNALVGTFVSHRLVALPRFRVKGIYQALAHSPVTNYWGGLFDEIYPQCLDCGVPPSFMLITRPAFERLAARGVGVDASVELPVDSNGLTLAEARSLDAKFDAIRRELHSSALGRRLGCIRFRCDFVSSLSSAVALANVSASAVTPAVTLLSDLGTGIALMVAAAAGVFVVRRRRSEAALAYARGEHFAVFGARTALEVLAPAIAGGAAGFALAYGFTDLFAPRGSISNGTVWSGVWHAAAAVAIAVGLLVGVAGFTFTRLYDTGSSGCRWLKWLPWEALVGVGALVLYLRIRSGGAVTSGAAHTPTLAVFLYPLLLVTAVAGIVARGARLALSHSAGRARHSPAAVFLALRRLGAARGLVVALTVVVAVSLASLFYVETLQTSLEHTTAAKAFIATGSDANVTVPDSQTVPKDFAFPVSRVQFSNQTATLADQTTPIDVMLVDPATLAKTLHWQSNWGPAPGRFLQSLANAPLQPLPVIVTTDLAHARAIVIDGRTFAVDRLAVVQAFPFMAQGIPLVVTSFRALHALEARTGLFDSLGVLQTYLLAKGPPIAAGRALASLQPEYPPQTTDTFLHDPNIVLATRTFGFMRVIAVGAGVIALLGLLLYLHTRQRSQAIASLFLHRMGLSSGEETASLAIELTAILAFAGVIGGAVALVAAAPVVRRIDPLPTDPPSPLFTIPWTTGLASAAALLALALAAGALTSWLARRADVGEALRVD